MRKIQTQNRRAFKNKIRKIYKARNKFIWYMRAHHRAVYILMGHTYINLVNLIHIPCDSLPGPHLLPNTYTMRQFTWATLIT